MAAPFDPSLYVRAPVITVATGVSLSFALVDACPMASPQSVQKAAQHLKATADKAQSDLADRNRALGTFTEEDSRVLDNEADRAWGGLRMRLQGMAMLSPDVYPNARRAAELDALLFTGGLEFVIAEYASQSATMGSILERIDADGLQADIDTIAGPEFLQALRDVQPRYEAMVSERLRRDAAMGKNLLATTRDLQSAIVNYAIKVIGNIAHDDPTTSETARIALLPIANFREAAAARTARTTPAATPPADPAAAGDANSKTPA